MYEFGNVYGKKEGKFIEEKRLSLSLCGPVFESFWGQKEETDPFFYFKGLLSDLFITLGYYQLEFEELDSTQFDMAFALVHHKQVYGSLGLIAAELNNQFGIDQDVYVSELNWDKLTQNAFSKNIQFEEVGKFPSVRRDFALLVDEEVTFKELEMVAFKTERKILTAVTLFDVYEGKNLPQGKKSYGINFTFQDKNKTLTDKQVDKIMDKLLKNFKEAFQAELR